MRMWNAPFQNETLYTRVRLEMQSRALAAESESNHQLALPSACCAAAQPSLLHVHTATFSLNLPIARERKTRYEDFCVYLFLCVVYYLVQQCYSHFVTSINCAYNNQDACSNILECIYEYYRYWCLRETD
mgnify:FL=1